MEPASKRKLFAELDRILAAGHKRHSTHAYLDNDATYLMISRPGGKYDKLDVGSLEEFRLAVLEYFQIESRGV